MKDTAIVLELNNKILPQAKKYVKKLMEKSSAKLVYHNYNLTCEELSNLEDLIGREKVVTIKDYELLIAMTFRLSGYAINRNEFIIHSQKIAKEFLEKNKYPAENTKNILQLIACTKSGKTAETDRQALMQDAVYAYYGKKKLRKKLENYFKEELLLGQTKINKKDWYAIQSKYFNKHTFLSVAAQNLYGERKKKNKNKIPNIIQKIEQSRKENSFSTDSAARMMFKTSLRNHIDLTAIGDQKANIMLSINAIILTIGIPVFVKMTDRITLLSIPVFAFIATCIISMVFAALATRPSRMDGEVKIDKLNNGKSDLFFFGNFYGIKQDTYQQLVRKVMDDRKLMDDSIINSLYFMGDVLGKKFIYLRRCYNTFIFGFIVSVVLFVIAYLIEKSTF